MQKYHNIYGIYKGSGRLPTSISKKTVHAIGKISGDGRDLRWPGAGDYPRSGRTSDVSAGSEGRNSQMEQEIQENYLGRTNSPRNYLFNQLDEKMSALMEDVRLGKKELE